MELYNDLRNENGCTSRFKNLSHLCTKARKGGSEVLLEMRTNTASFEVAKTAFWLLYNMQYDNKHLLLMTCNSKKINVYRY